MDIVFHRIESIEITRVKSGSHQWIKVLLTERDGREHDVDIFNNDNIPSLKICNVQILDKEAA